MNPMRCRAETLANRPLTMVTSQRVAGRASKWRCATPASAERLLT
jgi:hypothetical protein